MATDTKTPRYPPGPPTSQPGRKPDSETDEDRFYNGVTFASSDYVPWIFGRLRLGNCDTSRLAESGCPVMRNHDPDSLVGAVLEVRKAQDRWESDWRLPKISSNQRTFELMDSGILRGISVGGRLLIDTLVCDNEDKAKSVDDMLFTCDWKLVEESLTAIPADVRASVDRTLADVLRRDAPAIFDTLITEDGIFTTATADLQRRVEALRQAHNESIERQEEQMTTQTQVPLDLLERTINETLQRNETLKKLNEMPDQLETLIADGERRDKEMMKFGQTLNQLQYSPERGAGEFVDREGSETPRPWAQPRDAEPYDIHRAIRAIRRGGAFDEVDSYEAKWSQEQVAKHPLGKTGGGAIHFGALLDLQRATTTAAASGGAALDSPAYGHFRADTPDPIYEVPMRVMTISGGEVNGLPRDVGVTTPDPEMVAEPGDSGYTVTGTATADAHEFKPHIANMLTNVTTTFRMADGDSDSFWEALLRITSTKIMELMGAQIAAGAGAGAEVQGLYGLAGIGTATLANLDALDKSALLGQMNRSFFLGNTGNKTLILTPEARDKILEIAEIAAINPFATMEGGRLMVRDFSAIESRVLGAGKNARLLISPLMDVVVNMWGPSLYYSTVEYRGNFELTLSTFFDTHVRHPAWHGRLHEA